MRAVPGVPGCRPRDRAPEARKRGIQTSGISSAYAKSTGPFNALTICSRFFRENKREIRMNTPRKLASRRPRSNTGFCSFVFPPSQ